MFGYGTEELRMKRNRIYSWLMLLCSFVLAAATFAMAETPTSLQGATVVDAPKAKSLMESGAQMLDVRVANEYAEAHIKGAKSVPYKEKSAKAVDFDAKADSFDLAKLPGNKAGALVFSCNGPECWKSYKASVTAIKAGYTKVYWFRGGFPEWKSKGFPIE
jgi:rhodanese-related sulfurtransferase